MSEAARRLALALEESTKLLRAIAGGTRTTRALTQALANDEALTAYRTSDGGDGEVEALEAERERLKADPIEMLAEALYNLCPCGEQPTDADGRPTGPGGVIYWSQMAEYDPVEADKIRVQAQRLADPDAVGPAEALLSRLEWSASTPDLACCPLCSQKMDDGHSGDCGFALLKGAGQ